MWPISITCRSSSQFSDTLWECAGAVEYYAAFCLDPGAAPVTDTAETVLYPSRVCATIIYACLSVCTACVCQCVLHVCVCVCVCVCTANSQDRGDLLEVCVDQKS